MAIVRVEKNSYTVEPLYQWDVGQTLKIYGLSLPAVPEIHFSNDAMGRAIVRQATMDPAGVVTVSVPNSLLQKPYRVKVFVCFNRGDAFETLYKIEVPVKDRPQPQDYELTASDEEVYSFRALEAQVNQTLQQVEVMAVEVAEAKQAASVASKAAAGVVGTAEAAHTTAAEAQSTAQAAQAEASDGALVRYVDDVLRTKAGTVINLGEAKIASGTYAGTGGYGAEGAKSFTFDFAPQYMIITHLGDASDVTVDDIRPEVVFAVGAVRAAQSMYGLDVVEARACNAEKVVYASVSADGKTVSFYCGSGTDDLADIGTCAGEYYHYVAIG